MRKSSQVPLTLLAAVAVTAIGCHNGPRHCVDAQSRLLPDSACEVHGSGGGGYHYVYGGSSGGHTGDFVIGASESGIGRGGFGHSGGGDGGGE